MTVPGSFRVQGSSPLARRLARLVDAAQSCLARNVVAGRRAGEPAQYLRAGGGYPDPWTRDAAINTWQAGCWLAPRVSADTLRMVCEADGTAVVWDNQWWDQVIWTLGARQLALTTGDLDWARWSLGVSTATLARLDERCVDPHSGLYRGPAVMADGISAYPPALHDPGRSLDSFVLDHPATHAISCLSTNALFVLAMRATGDLAELTGADPTPWRHRADALAARVLEGFTIPGSDRLGYLRDRGRLDESQEGLGIALAVLAGVADPIRARSIVRGVQRAPRGLSAVWPPFPGLAPGRFARHGAALWPMIMGVWAQAVARTGDAAAFGTELDLLARLFEDSGHDFYEVYHPVTGVPDGGWQAGRDWRSEPDQTWSATTLLGTVLHGLAGLRPEVDGLHVQPCLPPGTGAVELIGLPWRGAQFTLLLHGSGSRITRVVADGRSLDAGPVHFAPDDVPDRLEIFCSEEERP